MSSPDQERERQLPFCIVVRDRHDGWASSILTLFPRSEGVKISEVMSIILSPSLLQPTHKTLLSIPPYFLIAMDAGSTSSLVIVPTSNDEISIKAFYVSH